MWGPINFLLYMMTSRRLRAQCPWQSMRKKYAPIKQVMGTFDIAEVYGSGSVKFGMNTAGECPIGRNGPEDFSCVPYKLCSFEWGNVDCFSRRLFFRTNFRLDPDQRRINLAEKSATNERARTSLNRTNARDDRTNARAISIF